jgi:ABC-type Fe3+/spermidine/putrescine transport system ATPase subunit
VSGLTKSYGRAPALSGVDLEIAAGACTAVLGPSGSGKSTLLRIVAGLVDADGGRVEIHGQVTDDPRRLVRAEERGVAFLFQDLALWPHMTVRGNLDFVLEARGVRKAERPQEAETAATSAEFPARLLDRRPGEISGGERQRAAIARVLAQHPRLLLLDEPLSHLDPELRAALLLQLRRIRVERGLAALLVTHEVGEAFSLAQQVLVMRNGRVEQSASPRDLYDRPRTRFGAGFVGRAWFVRAARRDGAVATPFGTFPAGDAPEGPLVAVVRPERVRAEPGGPVRARVVDAVYQGDHWLWATDLDGDAGRVLVRADRPAARGDEVALACDRPWFVPDESGPEDLR